MVPYPIRQIAMPRRPQSTPPLRIAIDTGGTFTDCVWLERGRVRMLKVFSTPEDPSRAIAAAVEKVGAQAGLVLLHGTTVGTNTLLERKGARTALVTTAGFEDAIEIGRQARPRLYDFFFDRVEPLVPKELRFGVKERVSSRGEVLETPAPAEIESLCNELRAKSPQAIAICLLFSFVNSAHERDLRDALKSLGLPLSVSHEILPEFREYERTSTVVINAYLQPIMQTYLENLTRRVDRQPPGRGYATIFVMQSSGGITPLETAIREPVRTLLSGPAGGVVGATSSARQSGHDRIISFDMGGTSTDVALVDRTLGASTQAEVASLPVGIPMLDIHTVGAGGGSIARFDAAGALRVGPESAGVDPGPVCYGRGTQPTVTDANLILGRLRGRNFLGGHFVLDLDRSRRVLEEWLKQQGSTLTLEKFAAGVVRVVNASMEKAIRLVSIERGYDPRDFVLVAFGGAGGLHACELAADLGIPRIIVPALPGALSAFGMLVSDVVKDYSRSILLKVRDQLPARALGKHFAELRRAACRDFRNEGWRGVLEHQFSIDLRYRGQGFELNVPFSGKILDDFQHEHRRRYGHAYPSREIELVTLRLRTTLCSRPLHLAATERQRERLTAPLETARVFFSGKGMASAVWSRERLPTGKRYPGPAVVTEYSATTIVPPGWRFWVDQAKNLIVDRG
jgi:N-methylhydantoinase A